MRSLATISDDAVDLTGEVDSVEVRKELQQILESQPFRTSRQCRDLLQYIVENSLRGQDAQLRERVVGAEVFGRPPDYDTAEDPVVRMRAADVRKRLAQFYQAEEPHALHIELKPGAYRASFRWAASSPGEGTPIAVASKEQHPAREPDKGLQKPDKGLQTAARLLPESIMAVPSQKRQPIWRVVVAVATALFLCGFAVWQARLWAGRTRAQARFWAPVTQAQGPVLLYVGSNVAYRFTPDYLNQYRQEHGLAEQNGPEFFPELPRGATIRADTLMQVKNTFVTTGDLHASVQVTSLLNSWGRSFVLRAAEDVSMSDLRHMPAVLIGGFNNRWSLATTDQLPLRFRDGLSIVDQAHPEQRWTVDPNEHRMPTEDFALISRVFRSSTGTPVLVLGGIGSYGTEAAAEFVSSPERMNELLRAAPAGWEGKNMQAVLRIRVVDYTPVSVDVVRTVFW